MKLRPEVLKFVPELEIRARRYLPAMTAGNIRSRFRGSGMQFREFRPYEFGDDIRHMSWSVTARTGHPTIKTFEEERDLNIVLVVDVSGSTLFSFDSIRKKDMMLDVTALLSLSAIKNHDNVGLLLFDENSLDYLPPKRTREQVRILLHKIDSQKSENKKSDLKPALRYLSQILKSPTMIIILSDFLVPDFTQEFHTMAKRHEFLLMHCYDDAERGMGLKGTYEVCDPETGEFLLLDGKDSEVVSFLSKKHMETSFQLERLTQNSRSDYLTLSTQDDYLKRIVHFFRERASSK